MSNEKILEILHEIFGLAGWRTDDQADASNESPEDMTAHVNGLIRQKLAGVIYDLEEDAAEEEAAGVRCMRLTMKPSRRAHRDYLLSQIGELTKMLERLPAERVIERMGIESRKRTVEGELNKIAGEFKRLKQK